ncbi:MAG: H-NS histone family protein [Silicimonas sp.]|nr:H-NS histone family protein [Silicimonas sp.]
MAAKIDLGKLSLEELKSLQKNVEKEIKTFKSRARDAAMKDLQQVAKKHGLSVDEILGKKGKGRKAGSPAKYRNPADDRQTWSGRGRQPTWYKEALSSGKTPESLEI